MELEEEMRRQETVRDVCLVILFCATVFLMLSMFGVTGPAGDIFSEIMFGLFGLTSYILPLFVFFTAAAAVIRGKDRFGTPEVLSLCGIMLAVTMICGLLEQDLYTSKNYSAEEIFKFCRDMKRGGGVIGGSLDWLLYHAVRVPADRKSWSGRPSKKNGNGAGWKAWSGKKQRKRTTASYFWIPRKKTIRQIPAVSTGWS